jgi:hypothetical protein
MPDLNIDDIGHATNLCLTGHNYDSYCRYCATERLSFFRDYARKKWSLRGSELNIED